jgi:hypothetical protein
MLKRQMVAACYTDASREEDIHTGNKHFFAVDTAVGARCSSLENDDNLPWLYIVISAEIKAT